MSRVGKRNRPYIFLGVGAVISGVAAAASGVAAARRWRRFQCGHAATVKDLQQVRREVGRLHRLTERHAEERATVVTGLQEVQREVRQLHELAADEPVLYLRGFMDGRGFTDRTLDGGE